MIYFIILILFSVLAYIYDINKVRAGKEFMYIIELLILISLAGFRYRVGGDSLAYEDDYQNLPTFSELIKYGFSDLPYQPLWYILNALTKSVSKNFFFFQLIHAIIINSCIFVFINKYCIHRFTFIVFYFIFLYPYFNFEILRESIAVVIFLFAFPLIQEKKYLRYYLLNILSFLFHPSALFLFIVPILYFLFKSNTNFLKLFFVGIIIILFSSIIVTTLIDHLPLNMFILAKLEGYTSLEININGIIVGLFNLLPVMGILYLLKKIPINNPNINVILSIYFILTLLSFIVEGSYRLLNYFSIFFYVILTDYIIYDIGKIYNAIKIYRKGVYKGLQLFILLCIFINKGYYYTRDMSMYNYGEEAYCYNRYIPYNSIFYPTKDYRRENIYFNYMDK